MDIAHVGVGLAWTGNDLLGRSVENACILQGVNPAYYQRIPASSQSAQSATVDRTVFECYLTNDDSVRMEQIGTDQYHFYPSDQILRSVQRIREEPVPFVIFSMRQIDQYQSSQGLLRYHKGVIETRHSMILGQAVPQILSVFSKDIAVSMTPAKRHGANRQGRVHVEFVRVECRLQLACIVVRLRSLGQGIVSYDSDEEQVKFTDVEVYQVSKSPGFREFVKQINERKRGGHASPARNSRDNVIMLPSKQVEQDL